MTHEQVAMQVDPDNVGQIISKLTLFYKAIHELNGPDQRTDVFQEKLVEFLKENQDWLTNFSCLEGFLFVAIELLRDMEKSLRAKP